MTRVKSVSDPQLASDRSSPPLPSSEIQHRILSSFTEHDYYSRTTYGSIQEESTVCCLAGQHFMTSSSQEFIRRSLSIDSAVHVDITDINGEGDVSYVPLSLRKCKRTIAPYSYLLSLIGWRPWFFESLSRRSSFWKYFNYIYPAVITVLILSNYCMQALICQGKFNIPYDTESSLHEVNMQGNCTWGLITFKCQAKYIMDANNTAMKKEASNNCQHIIPTFIIPSLVHFLTFAYGFYHFRMAECEQLFSLMERVFLQCHSTPSLQSALIRNSRLFFLAAILWLFCQVGLEILYYFSFKEEILAILRNYTHVFVVITQVLVAVKMLGMILGQIVNVAIAINYCVQCETLILYIKGICLRLHEKSMEIKSAMHEILGAREYISLLNGNVAKMMGLGIINFAELTILGTALLFLNKDTSKNIIAYRVLFPSLWFVALVVPLIQAARLSRTGSKLKQISFETRVFGYQNCPVIELDSFVLFVNGATLRSKLFGITIRSSTVIITLGLPVFILLTLMVVDILTLSGSKQLF